ncbi:hypothetical protein NSK_003347 [Nannochloropsis salina CCMP1776]|uniref:Golgi apparatus membrane protein TVP38 n=1 Tax=Nannochloropsis salina CCMP1776 TaxID=1027361 RepID=A0A4D9D9T7_9STRA|nr:hypothetical protein NSK_003347 [Nannochloropsis salina CCMP1776]|eukprot:TFJ85388.1 hypothetical protein NSK_003347 [Nannochloropsis salina CCMP1776]
MSSHVVELAPKCQGEDELPPSLGEASHPESTSATTTTPTDDGTVYTGHSYHNSNGSVPLAREPTCSLPPPPPLDLETQSCSSTTVGHRSRGAACRDFLINHRRFVFLFFLVVLLLALGSVALAQYKDELLQGAQYIQDRAPLSAVYMALLLALWIILCLPATLLEVVAGMIYTWPVAFVSLTVGKQLGCNLGFSIGQCITTGSFQDNFLSKLTKGEQDAVARARALERASSAGPPAGGELEMVVVTEEEEEGEEEEEEQTVVGEQQVAPQANGQVPTPHVASMVGGDARPDRPSPRSASSSLAPPSTRRRRKRRKGTPKDALLWAVKKHPWQICFLLRLLPVPIGAKNYGMACLPFPVLIYSLCVLVAEMPFTILWIHIGRSCRSLLEAMNGHGGGKRRSYWHEILLLVLSIVLLVALGVLMRRYTARYAKYLEEEREKNEEVAMEEEAKEEDVRRGEGKGEGGAVERERTEGGGGGAREGGRGLGTEGEGGFEGRGSGV